MSTVRLFGIAYLVTGIICIVGSVVLHKNQKENARLNQEDGQGGNQVPTNTYT